MNSSGNEPGWRSGAPGVSLLLFAMFTQLLTSNLSASRIVQEDALEVRVSELLLGPPFERKPDEALRLVLRVAPDLAAETQNRLFLDIARSYALDGYFADAISVYSRITESESDRSSWVLARQFSADCFEDAGRFADAIREWGRVPDESPRSESKAWALARLHSKLGRLPEAERFFSGLGKPTEEELRPGVGDYRFQKWNDRAEHFMRAKRWNEALEHWNSNPAWDPELCGLTGRFTEHVWLEVNQIKCLIGLARSREALSLATRAMNRTGVLHQSGLRTGAAELVQLYVELRKN